MTALGDLPQGAELPTAGIAAGAVDSTLLALAVQRDYGTVASYTALAAQPITVKKDGTNNLTISWTPDVASWWQVSTLVGAIVKGEATMHYMYLVQNISPAPAAGGAPAIVRSISAGKSSIVPDQHRYIDALYALAAATTYTITAELRDGDGGTWAYWRGPEYLQMLGVGWAR